MLKRVRATLPADNPASFLVPQRTRQNDLRILCPFGTKSPNRRAPAASMAYLETCCSTSETGKAGCARTCRRAWEWHSSEVRSSGSKAKSACRSYRRRCSVQPKLGSAPRSASTFRWEALFNFAIPSLRRSKEMSSAVIYRPRAREA